MFHSSAPYGEHNLFPAVCYSYVTPALSGPDVFYDANGCAFPPPPPLLSSSPPYLSSLPSYYLQRSSSSRCLPVPQHRRIPGTLNSQAFFSTYPPPPQQHHLASASALSSSSPTSSSCEFADFNSELMRRVLSTGDLQGSNGLQPSVENYNQEGGAIGGRVGRYSAEERKERIKRYRSKRTQRNFHKKITYACRKTLADSRTRVRGRFSRNGEPKTEAGTETEAAMSSFDSYNCNIYEQVQNYGGGVCSGNGASLLRQIKPSFPTDADDEFPYEEVLFSNFADAFSMDLL